VKCHLHANRIGLHHCSAAVAAVDVDDQRRVLDLPFEEQLADHIVHDGIISIIICNDNHINHSHPFLLLLLLSKR
jgi:hypothetical protein